MKHTKKQLIYFRNNMYMHIYTNKKIDTLAYSSTMKLVWWLINMTVELLRIH